jgi:hypothetical protein
MNHTPEGPRFFVVAVPPRCASRRKSAGVPRSTASVFAMGRSSSIALVVRPPPLPERLLLPPPPPPLAGGRRTGLAGRARSGGSGEAAVAGRRAAGVVLPSRRGAPRRTLKSAERTSASACRGLSASAASKSAYAPSSFYTRAARVHVCARVYGEQRAHARENRDKHASGVPRTCR